MTAWLDAEVDVLTAIGALDALGVETGYGKSDCGREGDCQRVIHGQVHLRTGIYAGYMQGQL